MHIDIAAEKTAIQNEIRAVKDAAEQREHELGQVKTYLERLVGRLEYLVGLEKKDAEGQNKATKSPSETAEPNPAGNADPAKPPTAK